MGDPSDPNPYASAQADEASRPVRRLRWFFFAGTLLTFVVLLVVWRTVVFAGIGVTSVSLGYFYWLELQKLFVPTSLGPGSDSEVHFFMMLAAHLLVSAFGGSLLLAVVWLTRKLSRSHSS